MIKKFFQLLKLTFKKDSLLRILQIFECSNVYLYGISLEFGVTNNKNKIFSKFVRGKSKFHYSNKNTSKKKNIFYSDLTKKIKISKNKYNNILLFNVLEHLREYKLGFSEIYRILKKNGKFVGSIPFIYQIHGAPKDYFRFSKQFLELNLSKNKFKKIKVKPLGFGPFVACYTLLHAYLKFIPVFNQLCLMLAYILDNIIQIFVKTDLKEIFPIGYFFTAKK